VQPRGEETRKQILSAAVTAFAQFGYDATGVAEICKTAGISKGAFYHHFPSKQTLYFELLNEWLATIDARLRSIASEAGSVPDALMKMTGAFTEIIESSRDKLPIFLEFLMRATRDPEIRKATLKPYRTYSEYFSDLIRKGVKEGTIRTGDPDTAAQILVSLAVGLVLQGSIDAGSTDWEAVATNAVRTFVRSILA